MKRILVIFLFFLSTSSLVFAQNSSSPLILRVAVVNQAPQITLSIKGPYEIKTLYTDELLDAAQYLKSKDVSPAFEGIQIGEKTYKIFGVRIKPQKEATILINDRRYRGEIDIIRTKEINLLLVNHIDLEEYLYGVLYHEVSHRWPMEALKAQAIVSRTYALYQRSVSRNKDYDLTSDFYSQVYGGKTSEKYRTTKAVNLTRRQILTYNGEVFPAYFHATCAGATEDASELWDIDLPPLKGVKCDFCKFSPHYRWRNSIPLEELKERLEKNGYDLEGVISVVPGERTSSGRIKILNLVTTKGEFKILAKNFRQIFDPQIIRSTNFDVEIRNDSAIFRGYGWGHGVGMCQWGAYFMALKGYKAEEILEFYYPGAEVSQLK